MKDQSDSAIRRYIVIGCAFLCLAAQTTPAAYADGESISTSGNVSVEDAGSISTENRHLNEEGSESFGPNLALNQYVSPQDFAPGLSNPGADYVFRSLAGFAWLKNELVTHRVYLGNANGDRFMSRTLSYCDGSEFGLVFDCYLDIVLHLYDRSQMNVQPLYKCFDSVAGDTYISWFEDCTQPGILGAPTGEGPYPYEGGHPDHLLGFTSCSGGPFWWITPYDPFDSDGDGIFGDCDVDDDNDGELDPIDNCPLDYNPLQVDTDSDGFGDACDSDDDNDGVPDSVDNCAFAHNPDQVDNDDDGIGDVCDSDDDNDGVPDTVDNCALDSNPDQEDNDDDGIGDVCDPDDDNDGVPDTMDNCAFAHNPDQEDNDDDGIGDVCDPDDDNDGVPDTSDNCPATPNPGQVDSDEDDVGDACDDSDQDGVFDDIDNCPVNQNSDQADFNNNGIGDRCENTDGDLFVDAFDNCILVPNNDQRDTNGDGFGNICDADLNNDCFVNFGDWSILGKLFLSGDADADFNGDGIVNFADFAIMVPLHLTEPGPSGFPINCQ